MPEHEVIDRVLAEVERGREEIVDFAAELIRIPTVNPPGEEYPACAESIGRRLTRDFDEVEERFGIRVITPGAFLEELEGETNEHDESETT